jgi:hypothetical protein
LTAEGVRGAVVKIKFGSSVWYLADGNKVQKGESQFLLMKIKNCSGNFNQSLFSEIVVLGGKLFATPLGNIILGTICLKITKK